MNEKGYRVVVRINDGEECGGYTGAEDPYTAIEKCLEGIRKEIPIKGRLTFDYFPVEGEQIKEHILTRIPPLLQADRIKGK